MNLKNKQKRQELKNIRTLNEYVTYITDLKITDEQRSIMDMIFIRGWNYNKIASELGYEEDTIKRKVRKILDIL